MSICPVCRQRVTNGADKVKREGIRYHKGCVVNLKDWRVKQKRIRKDERERVRFFTQGHSIYIQKQKQSPFKRIYQIFKERAGL